MAIWYVGDAGLQAMGGQLTATSLWTSVAAGAANTLGNWVQLHSAAPWPVAGMYVFLGQTGIATSATNTSTLLDVGVGTSGAEQVLVQNIAIGGNLPFSRWSLPISVASGARISVRLRSAVASKSCTMGMALYGGGAGMESGFQATTYGATTASSSGTALTAPGAINTEAAWTQITASTTAPMRWLVVGLAAPATTLATATNGLVDIGVGASGSEAAIITDTPYAVSASEDINCSYPLTYPVNIPVGTRLSARYRATSTATTGTPQVTLTGIN